MKTLSLSLLVLAAASAPAFAAKPVQRTHLVQTQEHVRPRMLDTISSTAQTPFRGERAVQLLALETGASTDQVEAVLRFGWSHPSKQMAYAFTSPTMRAGAVKMESALGAKRYADLISGNAIELHSQAVLESVRRDSASADASAMPVRVAML